MKKFLGLLALLTMFATPAMAGNSIRLTDLAGGGGTGIPLCDPTNCDTDGDVLVYNNTGSCLDCVECLDNEILSWDTATDTWVCDTAGTDKECPGPTPAAPTDGDILVWDAGASCFTGLNCADNQMLSYDLGTTSWGCVDVGNLCNAGTCADNALIQWNTATACYDCITCAADEVLAWDGSDWACVGGPVDVTANGVCIDDTVGDQVVGDDLEVIDQAFVGDELGVNTCDIDRTIASNVVSATNGVYNMHVFNNMLEGATASNQPEINTLFEAHIDSVSGMNYLGLARYFNIGGGDLAMNYGLEVGSLGWFAWNGTELQIQGEIGLLVDAQYSTGALAPDTAAGTIFFRHGSGVAGAGGAYDDSAFARYDLDWEFNDDVFIDVGLLGFGGILEVNATCIIDDGSDELFGDRDCDEVVDTAENPLDTYYLEVADGAGAISSFSGLEIGGTDWNDLALLQGCADTEVLSWNDGSNIWECTATAGFGVADHGALTGLTDDDHALYLDTTAADTFSATNWSITADTADGFDTKVIIANGGGSTGATRGAELILYGDDRAVVPGWLSLATGDSGSMTVTGNNASGKIDLVQEGAVANTRILMIDEGVGLSGDANDLVALDTLLLAFAAAGATDAANGVCLADDGADRIFHDTDCDGTKDAGEEFIDQAGGGALADSCQTIQAGQLDALETNFATLGTDTSGTNVRMRYRRFSNATTDYANYIVHVPDSLASTGNVTVTIWTRADGSADASGLGGVWDFEYAGRDDAETYDGAYTNTAFATETYTTLDDTTLHEISQTIAVASFTAGDWLPIRFSRDHDEAADTFDGSLDILTAEVCFPQE